MQPSVAVTEFLFAHEHAEATQRWYAGLLHPFVAFCEEQGVATIGEVSAPLVRRFFDAVRRWSPGRTLAWGVTSCIVLLATCGCRLT